MLSSQLKNNKGFCLGSKLRLIASTILPGIWFIAESIGIFFYFADFINNKADGARCSDFYIWQNVFYGFIFSVGAISIGIIIIFHTFLNIDKKIGNLLCTIISIYSSCLFVSCGWIWVKYYNNHSLLGIIVLVSMLLNISISLKLNMRKYQSKCPIKRFATIWFTCTSISLILVPNYSHFNDLCEIYPILIPLIIVSISGFFIFRQLPKVPFMPKYIILLYSFFLFFIFIGILIFNPYPLLYAFIILNLVATIALFL